MAEIIIMPKLGFNMDEGQLVKWHRRGGGKGKKGKEEGEGGEEERREIWKGARCKPHCRLRFWRLR